MAVNLESMINLAHSRTDDVDEAATQMEAYFLRQILKEMQPDTSNSLMNPGHSGRMFKEMLNEALADSMSKAGGIGLAGMIREQLIEAQGARSVAGKSAVSSAFLAASGRSLSSKTRAYGGGTSSLSALPLEGMGKNTTSNFGKRLDPFTKESRFHSGMDIAAPTGTKVSSTGAGTVIRAGNAGGYGNLVGVDHGGGLETRYAHLHEIHVRVGQKVNAGAELGQVGSTGRSTGPHLHFEVRRDGQALDPTKEIKMLKNPGNRSSR